MAEILKRFSIEKNEEVLELIDKYSFCKERYALTDEEEQAFHIVSKLSEYERVLWYAISEYKSSRRIAKLFNTNNNYTSKSISELKNKVRELMSKDN